MIERQPAQTPEHRAGRGATDTSIELTGLTKAYRDVLALSDVTLEVPSGVVFGYVGPNGAGKTTTVSGHEILPTSGHLRPHWWPPSSPWMATYLPR